MKALRIYYDKDGEIIWTSGLSGPGDFPRTLPEELRGLPDGTNYLEVDDEVTIDQFQKASGNQEDGREEHE